MTKEKLNRVRSIYANMEKASGIEYERLQGSLIAERMYLLQVLQGKYKKGLLSKEEYNIMRDLYAYNCSLPYLCQLYGISGLQLWYTVRNATKKICG